MSKTSSWKDQQENINETLYDRTPIFCLEYNLMRMIRKTRETLFVILSNFITRFFLQQMRSHIARSFNLTLPWWWPNWGAGRSRSTRARRRIRGRRMTSRFPNPGSWRLSWPDTPPCTAGTRRSSASSEACPPPATGFLESKLVSSANLWALWERFTHHSGEGSGKSYQWTLASPQTRRWRL